MSGGHFDYQNYHLYDFAQQIRSDLKDPNKEDLFGNNPILRECAKQMIPELEKMNELLRAYDYMVSGDDETSFQPLAVVLLKIDVDAVMNKESQEDRERFQTAARKLRK